MGLVVDVGFDVVAVEGGPWLATPLVVMIFS